MQSPFNIIMFNMSTYADWESGITNRNRFILKELLKSSRVAKILCVDFLHTRKKRLLKDYWHGIVHPTYCTSSFVFSWNSRCCQVSEKLFVYSSIQHLFSPAKLLNETSGLLSRLDMQKSLLVWSYNPLFVEAFMQLPCDLHIFDTVDNWLTHTSYQSQKKLLEDNYAMIANKADIIFTVSSSLLDFYATFGRTRDIFWIPNGVDMDIVREISPLPDSYHRFFQALQRPIFGYVGTINEDRLDVDLIASLAAKFQKASIVLVGPVWKGVRQSIQAKLARWSNIFFLGRVHSAHVPSMIHLFDVCLNPHRQSPFIQYVDVMKVYEYLALGKPVVSTHTQGMERFLGIVSLARDTEEFLQYTSEALQDTGQERREARKAWASQNSYAIRVRDMLHYISHYV